MNKGYEKRKQLFDKYSNQLLLLNSNGVINIKFKNERPYLCPLCLDEFSENDLAENSQSNFLTLEDAPPASLGGSKIALTCKRCNSRCGHEIDKHLIEAVREVDRSYFYKGSQHRGTIDFDGKRLNVELTSQGDGTLTAYHRLKNNHPKFHERFIYAMKSKSIGPILNIKPPKSKVDSKKVSYALLKTHYIITFAKFGYIFLLDKEYDQIREQLKNPDKEIFLYSPFIKDQFSRNSVNTYYVHNKGIESIFNIFILKTEYSETIFGGLLNLPTTNFQKFAKQVDIQKDQNMSINLDTSFDDPSVNLFVDFVEIVKILNWIAKTGN